MASDLWGESLANALGPNSHGHPVICPTSTSQWGPGGLESSRIRMCGRGPKFRYSHSRLPLSCKVVSFLFVCSPI
jgi:hypothetical protein